MPAMPLAALLVLGCALLAPGPAAARNGTQAPLLTLEPWIIFCDNTGGCGLSNIAAHPGSSLGKESIPDLCLWQGPVQGQDAFLSLRLDDGSGSLGESIIIQPVSGASESPAGPATVAQGDGTDRYLVRGAALSPLLAAMAKADAALIREREDGAVMARVSLTRLARALHAADSYRKPEQPRPTHRLRPIEPMAPGDVAAARPLLHEHCSNALPGERPAQAFRLGADLQLWSMFCRHDGFYNMMSLALTVGADGTATPLDLPSVVDHDGVGPDISNLAIHPAEGIIEDFRKRAGAGDCGIRRRWGWTGARFELLTEDYMPYCFGARSSRWLRLHRADETGLARPGKSPC
jgi:hypothetical protein